MKNSLIAFLVCLSALLSACCKDAKTLDQPVAKAPEVANDTILSLQPLLYSLASASADIKSFDSLVCTMKKNNIITPKAYTIHNCDLLRAMGMSCDSATDMHVRVYLGYHAGVGLKLFVVPAKDVIKSALTDSITAAGTDYFLDSTGAIVRYNSNSGATYNVLDLNAPCPNTCDKGSPLYKVKYNCN